jgi:hypothetical protein
MPQWIGTVILLGWAGLLFGLMARWFWAEAKRCRLARHIEDWRECRSEPKAVRIVFDYEGGYKVFPN